MGDTDPRTKPRAPLDPSPEGYPALTPAVARAEFHAAAERLDPALLVLLAAALRLGPPGGAVAAHGAAHGGGVAESGDVAGASWSTSARGVSGPRERAAGACDAAAREVAAWLGRPLPSPHAVERAK